MSNLLKTLCIVLSLIYISAANPLEPTRISTYAFKEIIHELKNLTSIYRRPIECNSSLVPNIGIAENVSVAEISCRAIISLERVCESEKANFRILISAFSHSKNNMTCSINLDEEKDLHSVLRYLLSFFKRTMYNYQQNY